MGESAWVDALARFQALSRDLVASYRGRLVTQTGDGVLATFDGAARGLRCAMDLSASARELGLPIRAAVHTGEIDIDDDDIHGLAVHETARILGLAGADEVLASDTTVSLAGDADFTLQDRGSHELRGIEGSRQLYGVG
jgi:class 3 adenylate cyclase